VRRPSETKCLARFTRVGLLLVWIGADLACRPSADTPLGSPESYLIFQRHANGDGSFEFSLDKKSLAAASTMQALNSSVCPELLRTLYVLKALVRNAPAAWPGHAEGEPGVYAFSEGARTQAGDAAAFVLGAQPGVYRGLVLRGFWLGSAVERPNTAWVGLPDPLPSEKALPVFAAGAIADLIADFVASGGTHKSGEPSSLSRGYKIAMQVIAMEWRTKGTRLHFARLPPHLSQIANRFAQVRSGRAALQEDGFPRRPSESLRDPLVAATVFYRLFQNKKLTRALAERTYYEPFVGDRLPEGIDPAVLLGAFRNLQAKILGVWIRGANGGSGPTHIGALLSNYAAAFPDEAAAVFRDLVIATLGPRAFESSVEGGATTESAAIQEMAAARASPEDVLLSWFSKLVEGQP